MSLRNRRDPILERERLLVIVATVLINVVAVSLLTFASWSDWRTGVALNIVDNCLLVGFVLARRDALLARDFFFSDSSSESPSLLPMPCWSITRIRSIIRSVVVR